MKYNAGIHRRHSIRLQGYDYAQEGAYLVTVCTRDRECLFGEIINGEMRLSAAGEMVAAVWNDLPRRFPQVELDAFIIMPNHIHGILCIAPVGAQFIAPNPDTAPNPDNQGAMNRAPTVGDNRAPTGLLSDDI